MARVSRQVVQVVQVVLGLRAFGESWQSTCHGIAGWWRNNPRKILVLKMDKQSTGEAGTLMGILSNVLKDLPGGGGANRAAHRIG